MESPRIIDACDNCKFDPEYDNKTKCSECCHNYDSQFEPKEEE